jgi:assimilatory nitrate reductase catalytic subunit
MIVRAAEMWGPAETSFLLHARGIEHHSKGVENCMAAINLVVATGRLGRESCGYAMITGQGNGQGGREQGQKCDQLPGARDLENPEHRQYIADVWGVDEASIPHTGLSAVPLLEAIHDGQIKGLFLICFNPAVSLPDGGYIREALERLEFFAVVDFFLSETARYADIVLPGSLMEEDEGTTTNVEGRVIHHRQVVRPPAGAREDWRIICDLARRLGAGDKFSYQSTRDIFEELRIASKGGVADYAGITWERIDRMPRLFLSFRRYDAEAAFRLDALGTRRIPAVQPRRGSTCRARLQPCRKRRVESRKGVVPLFRSSERRLRRRAALDD